MSGWPVKRTYSILTFPDLDEAIAFYEALDFRRTYRQLRPNPHSVVQFEDIAVHLSAVDGFDPATSLGSVIVVVPDAEALYKTFAAGLRQAYGRLPSAGIPASSGPAANKVESTAGFTVVDIGGNWLRIYRAGDSEDDPVTAARVWPVRWRSQHDKATPTATMPGLSRCWTGSGPTSGCIDGRAGARAALPGRLLTRLSRVDEAAAALQAAQTGLTGEDVAALRDDLAHARQVARREQRTPSVLAEGLAQPGLFVRPEIVAISSMSVPRKRSRIPVLDPHPWTSGRVRTCPR